MAQTITNVNALLTGNLARVLAVLQEGIATEEHQNFKSP
jgi:type IV secretory pathway VirB2 component (pilin)